MSIKKYLVFALFCFQSAHLLAKDYSVSFFGIHSDGITLNTRSIQFAIDYINQNGGGRLVFPVGRYLTGSIHLKSNTTLHLEEGAVLLGSLNPFDYEKNGWTALIFANDQANIGITGKGTIDGQGKDVALNLIDIIDKGLVKDPLKYGRPVETARPMNVYFRSCTNISILGVTFRNSGSWNQTYDQCRQVRVDSIYVDNKEFWNQDGIDIVDCDSVTVTNSYFDAADDCICLKSHDAKVFCNNILIRNNLIRSSANGIKFGTASRGGFKNIRILNNKVFDTYRSAIALEAVDGGFVENIEVDSLRVYNTGNIIFLRIGERLAGKKGRLENVSIRNVYAEVPATKPDAGYSYEGPIEDMPRNISPAVIITGMPDAMISGVTLKNIEIKHPGGGNPFFAKIALDSLDKVPEAAPAYPDFSMFKELPAWGIYIRHARDLHFSSIKLSCEKKDYRPAVVLDDVHQSRFSSVTAKQPDEKRVFFSYKSAGVIIE